MTLSHSEHARLDAQMQNLKSKGVPFAMATVVRTVDATSAKPGGKALIAEDGTIIMGWVGGGCARGAVGRAAKEAIASGQPQLISLRPQELLEDAGVAAGDERDGVRFARNGCPSKGTMDLFVEPVLPLVELVIYGEGLVASALAELGERFDYKVLRGDAAQGNGKGFVVVATQGQGDLAALKAVADAPARHVCFVGSKRKFATLKERLLGETPELAAGLARIKAPAGADINAITPDEIALSILAEITRIRRAKDGATVSTENCLETAI